MQGFLRPQGYCDKNSEALTVLPFAAFFSPGFCCGLCVWRWFFNTLRTYARIGIFFFFLYLSILGIENITENSFQYLQVFPFVSNFGCCYRRMTEIEITILSHW